MKRAETKETNAFSKEMDNLKTNVALHDVHDNFGRIHRDTARDAHNGGRQGTSHGQP
jgi:hypothetical protein